MNGLPKNHLDIKPSERFLNLEKEIRKTGNLYFGFFHNHNLSDIEDSENKVLILPSNCDIWDNKIFYMGLIRNFRRFSDLRIFFNDISSDYPYPPRFFIKINTPLGEATRIIKSSSGFSVDNEEKIEFLDPGYVETSKLIQAV